VSDFYGYRFIGLFLVKHPGKCGHLYRIFLVLERTVFVLEGQKHFNLCH
jgi:hypothetical protein